MNNDELMKPPHSVEAEQSVIGGLMLRNDAWDEVSEVVNEDDFFLAQHREIFRAIAECAVQQMPFDAVTLSEKFDDKNTLSYLAQLITDTPSAANVIAYTNIVRENSMRRKAIGIVSRMASDLFDSTDSLDAGINELMSLAETKRTNEGDMRTATKKAMSSIDGAMNRGEYNGVTAGIRSFDKLIGGGYYSGDLYVIGGRPGMGKTSLLLDSIEQAAYEGKPVGVISTEQPDEQIAQRMMSKRTGVPVAKMRSGDLTDEEFEQLWKVSKTIIGLPVMLNDSPGPTITDVARIARKWKKQQGIRALYVDYIQRVKGGHGSNERHNEVSDVVRGLKTIARELSIPVIGLSQVNRGVDTRLNKRPYMADFAWSADIENEADTIITVYRDEVYNPETSSKGEAELSALKARHGKVGTHIVAWRGSHMSFGEMAHPGERNPPHWAV